MHKCKPRDASATVDNIFYWTPKMVEYVNIFSMSLCKKYSQQKLKINTEHHKNSTTLEFKSGAYSCSRWPRLPPVLPPNGICSKWYNLPMAYVPIDLTAKQLTLPTAYSHNSLCSQRSMLPMAYASNALRSPWKFLPTAFNLNDLQSQWPMLSRD